MNEPDYESIEDLSDILLPSQYHELLRKPAGLRGEYRLMWAVLDDAIRCYLANMKRATSAQRRDFAEVRGWFLPAQNDPQSQGLFAFQTICDLLDINARGLVKRLESIRLNSLSIARWRPTIKP